MRSGSPRATGRAVLAQGEPEARRVIAPGRAFDELFAPVAPAVAGHERLSRLREAPATGDLVLAGHDATGVDVIVAVAALSRAAVGVEHPLARVAGHVERADRGGPPLEGRDRGEPPLVHAHGVADGPVARIRSVVAPRVDTLRTAVPARGSLPLRLGREAEVGPRRVILRLDLGDLDDRVVVLRGDSVALGDLPVGGLVELELGHAIPVKVHVDLSADALGVRHDVVLLRVTPP